MKRALLILTLVLCSVLQDKAYAQRALPGMRGLEVRGGMADGFYSSANRNESGYYFGAAMSRYTKNANKWVCGVEYLSRYYPYKSGRIPIAQFTGEGGYYYKFLADGSKTFFFYLGGSARNKDRFLYGGAITLEIETYLSDRIILSMSGRERILWGTTSGHFHTQFGIGLKFIID